MALGLVAVITASPSAFTALKWWGAIYLAWLAWGAWNTPVEAKDMHASAQNQTPALTAKEAAQMWGRGFTMNLTNPKILIFFLTLLPQFANPELSWPVSVQILIFGILFMCVALLVFGSIAYFSGALGRMLQKSARAQRVLNRLASVVFVVLAICLASLQR